MTLSLVVRSSARKCALFQTNAKNALFLLQFHVTKQKRPDLAVKFDASARIGVGIGRVATEAQLSVNAQPSRSTSDKRGRIPQIARSSYVLILIDFNPSRINTYMQGCSYPPYIQHLREIGGWGESISEVNHMLFTITLTQLIGLSPAKEYANLSVQFSAAIRLLEDIQTVDASSGANKIRRSVAAGGAATADHYLGVRVKDRSPD